MKNNFTPKSKIRVISLIVLTLFFLSIPTLYAQEVKEPEISVTSFSPRAQNGEAADFLITFSQPVIDNNLLFTELPQNIIHMTPAVDGKARWMALNQIGLFLDTTLAPSVEYTFEIKDTDFTLTGQRAFTYSTPPFKIEKAEIGFHYDNALKKSRAIGSITFNYPVSIVGLNEFLSILTGRGDNISYTFQTQNLITKKALIEIDDIGQLLEGQYLQVRMEKGFRGIGTEIGLQDATIAPIQLGQIKELRIEQPNVGHRDGKPYFGFYFSSPITLETLKERITIDPAIPFQVVVNDHNLEIHADFQFRSDYTVNINLGITSIYGHILKYPYVQNLKIPDLPRNIRFTDDTFFLPRKGELPLNLATSNIENVSYGITKVYTSSLPELIHQGELTIESRLNEEVITPLPLRDILNEKHAGIFKIVVHSNTGRTAYAEKLIVVTDLGIAAKKIDKELWVWVNSLDALDPIPEAKVQLINQTNKETHLTGETDAAGFVKFSISPDDSTNNPQFLLTVTTDDDFSILKLQQNQISTNGFDIHGIPYLKDGYEAFLYTDRGVYRPGETVNLVAIVRGQDNEPLEVLPIRIEVTDQNGVIPRVYERKTDKDGASEIQIPLPPHAPTGYYAITMSIHNKQIGYASFQVEEYMPDRMKVSLKTDQDTYKIDDEIHFKVNAVNLFGAPAVGRKIMAACSLEPQPYQPPEKWQSFHFTDSTRTFDYDSVTLDDTITDHDGNATFQFTMPNRLRRKAGLYIGGINATVQELGGRAVTASDLIFIHPYSHYVGIKRTETGTVKLNEDVTFQYIVIDTDENLADGRPLTVTISAIDNTYRRHRNTSPEVKQLESYTIESKNRVADFSYTPVTYGVHRVEVEDVESTARVSTEFFVSQWSGVPWSVENPNTLDMTLDKKAYRSGDKAKLTVKPPFPGKLLLTIEREKVVSYQTIMVNENSATLTIPVQDIYAPNVYLSAMLLRSTKSLKKDETARAYGIIPLKIDAEQHRLNVEIDAPERIRPNREVDINIRVNGGNQGQSYRVSIAAVDEGILQLTRRRTPDPHHRFYQQRRLNTNSYEFHNAITQDQQFPIKPIESLADLLNLDMAEATKKAKRRAIMSYSDVSASVVMPALPPTRPHIQIPKLSSLSNTDTTVRVKSVALWSGLTTTDANGHGTIRFKIPQFNGTLRVMAVAFSGTDYGSATEQIKVREPVVLMPTFPRFLSGGDRIRVPVSVFNGTGKKRNFKVNLQADGPIQLLAENDSINDTVILQGNSIQKHIEIDTNKEDQLFFDVIAHDAVGIATFKLSVSRNGEEIQHAPVRLPVRSPAPPATITGQGILREGEPAEFIFPSNLRADTSAFMVSVSPLPAVRFASGLRYLVQYPHGCLEQTTSKVFPLLYFTNLAKIVEPALADEGKIGEYVNAGIEKLQGMLLPEHHFSYWQGRPLINNWSSIYTSHFLVEARKAGYKVSDTVYNRMLEGLRIQARKGGTFNIPNEKTDSYILSQAAYACYVLAAAGAPEKLVMHFLRNNRLGEFKDYSHFHLAGAFALSGDIETALTLLPESIDLKDTNLRDTGRNFDSSIRAQAIMLDILVEVKEDHPAIPKLIESLTESAAKAQRWTNTQENACAILALGKFLKKLPHQKFTGTITRNGTKPQHFDSTGKQYIGSDWDGERIKLTVKGNGTCYYYWEAFGVSRDSYIQQYGNGIHMSRRYLTPDGSRVKNVFKQGELIIAEITFESLNGVLENVAVVDMLPAGFEIENSRLASRQDTPELYDQEFNPNFIDIRDDRLIFYATFPFRNPQKFYYPLRAITEGEFTVPPVSAEAMYDPTKSAVASSGTIQVVK